MSVEFGLLSYDSINLGDEIQSLAARRFLPRVDRYVPRERLDVEPGGAGRTRLILNGWFMHSPERWPPHVQLQCLLVSFHLSTQRPSRWPLSRPPARTLLAARNLTWLRQHGPIGTRDRHTLDLLQRRGVDSYYSGCLTLTLASRSDLERSEDIVACDLPREAISALAARTRRPPIVVGHHDRHTVGAPQRMRRAAALLDTYARAKAVVTTRLHCALPCLALGTPVLFLPVHPDRPRQEPALELAHHQSLRDFLAGRCVFDLDDPPPNPDRFRALVPDLVRRCERFVSS